MSKDGERPSNDAVVGQVDATKVPRYAGLGTFGRLPLLQDITTPKVAVLGVPFDSGTSYRPGARFGPAAIRQASRLLRAYDPALDIEPFAMQQVVDAGDVPANPYSIPEALTAIETDSSALLDRDVRIVLIGGDHTITYGSLRAVHRKFGPVALVHFDAHLDTWDTYFGARITHGSMLRRAAEEKLFDEDASMHVGIRGSLYDRSDLSSDASLGFKTIHCRELDEIGVSGVVDRIRQRVGDRPLYLSIDIDVLDPAHAPGTGTPELGGMSSRELLAIIQGLSGLQLIGGDVVEVSPPFDHAEITSLAAATLAYKLVGLFALSPTQSSVSQPSPSTSA
jgi:agmatinase